MPKFRDIKPFTLFTGYSVDVSWSHMETQLASMPERGL